MYIIALVQNGQFLNSYLIVKYCNNLALITIRNMFSSSTRQIVMRCLNWINLTESIVMLILLRSGELIFVKSSPNSCVKFLERCVKLLHLVMMARVGKSSGETSKTVRRIGVSTEIFYLLPSSPAAEIQF